MKIFINIDFETDGDYRVDNFEKYEKEPQCNAYAGFEEYHIRKVFEGEDEQRCKMFARQFLEEVLCNLRFNPNHRQLIPMFYKMFDEAVDSVNRGKSYSDYISGNYNGTQVQVAFFA